MSPIKDPPGTKRVVAIIQQDIHISVKVLCALRNITMNQYFTEALIEKLAKDHSRQ